MTGIDVCFQVWTLTSCVNSHLIKQYFIMSVHNKCIHYCISSKKTTDIWFTLKDPISLIERKEVIVLNNFKAVRRVTTFM